MSEERRGLRFPFEADAEVAPEASPSATITAKVRQIGLHGCFLETGSPFASQTAVLLKIFKPGDYFEAKATVVHVQPPNGMGLAFRELKPNFRGVLQKWLLAAMRQDAVKSS